MRNQWPIGKFLRCRNKGLLKLWGASRNEQMVVEVHMKWHQRIHAQMTQWTNESMNEWISESMNQWMQSVNRWFSKSLNAWNEKKWKLKMKWPEKMKSETKWNGMKWMNERTTNEWIGGSVFNESVNQWSHGSTTGWWVDKSMNRCINDPMIQWINDPMIQWIKEPTYQCTSELLSRWFN